MSVVAPVATTLKVAVDPALTVWLAGGVVMTGTAVPEGGMSTWVVAVSVASMLLVAVMVTVSAV